MGREQIGIGLAHRSFGSDLRRARIRWSDKPSGPFALTPRPEAERVEQERVE